MHIALAIQGRPQNEKTAWWHYITYANEGLVPQLGRQVEGFFHTHADHANSGWTFTHILILMSVLKYWPSFTLSDHLHIYTAGQYM